MNMTKQYRAEIRDLKRNLKTVERNWRQFERDLALRHNAMSRERARALRATGKQVGRINRRLAILEGRLA